MNEIDKREFTNVEVFAIATMSAGKSTLINALLSKKLLPSSNEACTATITKIINKNQIIDIEDSVLLQINMAINQIKKDKDIMLLSLNDEQINMFNKALEMKKDIRRK